MGESQNDDRKGRYAAPRIIDTRERVIPTAPSAKPLYDMNYWQARAEFERQYWLHQLARGDGSIHRAADLAMVSIDSARLRAQRIGVYRKVTRAK